MLLDLDGTLVDSEPGIMRSLQWAFEREGFPQPTDDEVRSVIGPPFEVGLPSIGIPDDALVRVIATYRERYEDIGLYEASVYDGVPELLDGLLGSGYTLAIATAKPEHSARRVLDHFDLTRRCEVIVGATLTSERRTKAAIITHAMGLLGIPTGVPDIHEHVIMVGDRDYDVLGASQNRIPCIGVTYGYGSPEELLTAGAIALAERALDVADLVGRTYRSPDDV